MPNPDDASRPPHRFELPAPPPTEPGPVKAWQQSIDILTYLPDPADPNPMFLEKRVYQGSSGRVYPLPYIDRIATEGNERAWQAVHIENEYSASDGPARNRRPYPHRARQNATATISSTAKM